MEKKARSRRGRGRRSRAKRSLLQANQPPLTARGVAELCGVELKTVHNWVARDLLPHFRTPGRHLRFQRADVERFVRRQSGRASRRSPTGTAVLVIAAPRRRRTFERVLRGHDPVFVADVFEGLILAGKMGFDVLVVDRARARGSDASAVARAVKRQLPDTRVLWVGAQGRGQAHVTAITLDELRERFA